LPWTPPDLAPCRFDRWFDHKWGQVKSKREWMKLHAMTGVRTNQINEVMCKVIAHNLCVLIACIHDIGLDLPAFNSEVAC
jgi:hypothetical protein